MASSTTTETNEYLTIIKCKDALRDAIVQDPLVVADKLFEKQLISEDKRKESKSQSRDNYSKANVMIDAVIMRIQLFSCLFTTLLSVLNEIPWLQDVVKYIQRNYQAAPDKGSGRKKLISEAPADAFILEAMAAENIDKEDIPDEGPFISPAAHVTSRRYFEVKAFGRFTCPNNHHWKLPTSRSFVDLKTQTICYRYKYHCEKCGSEVAPRFTDTSLRKIAKQVVRQHIHHSRSSSDIEELPSRQSYRKSATQTQTNKQEEPTFMEISENWTTTDQYTNIESLIESIAKALKRNEKVNRKHAHCMFIGPGDSGKSSLLHRLIGKRDLPSTSTGVAEAVVMVDAHSDTVNTHIDTVDIHHSVVVPNSDTWKKVEFEKSLMGQIEQALEKALEPQKLKSECHATSTELTSTSNQLPSSTPTPPNLDDEDKKMIAKTVNDFQKFIKSKFSLYLRDAGGQAEFQEMVSLLVYGPSLFFFVFRAELDLKSQFDVGYRKSECETINTYRSSITLEEALLQSLASVYAMRSSDTAPIKTHKPYILIVATHRDKLGPSTTERIEQLNKDLHELITTNGFKYLVEYANYDKKQVMFTVDNTSESDDDFKPIREKVHDLVSNRKEFKIEYPLSYLLFCLKLQQDERSILTLDECRDMAKKYGIEGDQVIHLLNFLHLRIGVIQFINIEGARPLILKKPENLFNKVTNIVVGTFLRGTLTSGEEDDLKTKGILPESTFENVHDSEDSIDYKEFIQILIHLHLIIELPPSQPDPEARYFIPSVLNHVPESTEKEKESPVTPLAITFECKHCPRGLFGVLITYLMSDSSTFELIEEKISKNQVSLTVKSPGAEDRVSLKAYSSHFEIKFFPKGGILKNKAICFEIRQKIEASIVKSVKKLNYNAAYVKPQMSFECVHCSKPHPVKDHSIYCDKKDKNSPIPDEGRCWFDQGDQDDNQAESQTLPASKQEMHSLSTAIKNATPVSQEPHNGEEKMSIDDTQEHNLQSVDDSLLDIENLGDVLDEVETLSSRWRFLSTKLHIRQSTLDEIGHDHQGDAKMCLYKALGEWLKLNYNHERHGRPSWRKLAEAVRSLDYGLSKKIAANIKT